MYIYAHIYTHELEKKIHVKYWKCYNGIIHIFPCNKVLFTTIE